jgi:Spy/CpxP family protein refolding chaperone
MKIKALIISTVAAIAFSSFAYAQDAKPIDNQDSNAQEKSLGKREQKHRRHGKNSVMRGLKELNLSDAQKEQVKLLKERNKSQFQPQREEIKTLASKKHDGIITADEENRLKELKGQMKANGQKSREEMMTILTPEQKSRFDQKRNEMRGKMKERRGNRGESTRKPQEN